MTTKVHKVSATCGCLACKIVWWIKADQTRRHGHENEFHAMEVMDALGNATGFFAASIVESVGIRSDPVGHVAEVAETHLLRFAKVRGAPH